MKKILMIAALAMTMGLVSCNNASPEEKAKEFVDKGIEAMKSGDDAATKQLDEEMEKYVATLSPEDQAKFKAALEKYTLERLGDMFGAAANSAAGEIEEAADEAADAIDEAADEAIEEATEEAE